MLGPQGAKHLRESFTIFVLQAQHQVSQHAIVWTEPDCSLEMETRVSAACAAALEIDKRANRRSTPRAGRVAVGNDGGAAMCAEGGMIRFEGDAASVADGRVKKLKQPLADIMPK